MPEASILADALTIDRLSVEDVKGSAAMALCTAVCDDALGVVFRQAYNPLEPCVVVDFSSASRQLRALSTQALRQQLRDEHEAVVALCRKMGMGHFAPSWRRTLGCKAVPWSCKVLREALSVDLGGKGLTAADLATLGELGSSLPVLESLTIYEGIIEHHTNLDTGLFESLEVLGIDVNATPSAAWLALGTTGYDGVLRLAEGLGAGALPTVTRFCLDNVHVSDAGASALAAALSRGALLRLVLLELNHAALSDAGLVAFAPALRRLPALEHLDLMQNPLGDEGLAALVAPPLPPTGALAPATGGLTKLEWLSFNKTQVTDAGCAALAAALESGAMPALEQVKLYRISASATAIDTVYRAFIARRR